MNTLSGDDYEEPDYDGGAKGYQISSGRNIKRAREPVRKRRRTEDPSKSNLPSVDPQRDGTSAPMPPVTAGFPERSPGMAHASSSGAQIDDTYDYATQEPMYGHDPLDDVLGVMYENKLPKQRGPVRGECSVNYDLY